MRALLALLVAVGALACASSALGAVTQSSITTPTDGTFPLYTADAPNTVHVAGTADDGPVDLVCFFGSAGRRVLAEDVVVAAGAFDATVPLKPLGDPPRPRPLCTLRAIPANDLTNYPPDQASTFTGPDIGVGSYETLRIPSGINQGTIQNYELMQAQKKGEADLMSAGGCGLDYAFVFDPLTFAQSDPLFYCNGWFSDRTGCAVGSGTCEVASRSDVRVDGVNTYMSSRSEIWNIDATHKSTLAPGYPTVTLDKTIDPLSGDVHLTESPQIVRCSPNAAAFHPNYSDPAWASHCSSFTPVGVRLDRTITVDRDGRRITMMDVWSSTDGASHSLDLNYGEDFNGDPGSAPSPSFQHSWAGPGYAPVTLGLDVAGPSTDMPVTLLGDGNAGTADTFQWPQGAVTFSDAPTNVHWTYAAPDGAAAKFHFVRTVTASGTVIISHSYIQGATKDEVTAQIPEEQARLGRPKIALTSATSVDSPAYLATGTATDPAGGITGLTVNGDAVSVGADGSWSKAITLSEGANTITAVATDTSGNTTTFAPKVTYTPPPPAQPVPVPIGASPDKTAPTITLGIVRTRLRALLTNGLPLKVRWSEPSTFSVTLKVGSRTVGKASGRLGSPSSKRIVVKLTKKAKKQLKKLRKFKLTVKLAARDAAGNVTRKSATTTIKR